MKQPWYQSLLSVYLPAVIAGIVLVASIGDTLLKLEIIPPVVTYIGTVCVLLALGFGYFVLPKKPIPWVSKDGDDQSINSLELKHWLMAIGFLAALWFPRLLGDSDNGKYVQINLSPWANFSIAPSYHLSKALTGPVILDGIPFFVPEQNGLVIQTQNNTLLDKSTDITIPVDIPNPKYIHFLLNGVDVPPEIRSKTNVRIGPKRRQPWQNERYFQQNRS